MLNVSSRVKDTLSFLWKTVPGRSQWYLLWILNSKFNVGVSGIVTNEEGLVLLLKHVYRRSYNWGLPSGWVKRNETVEEALKREIKEEVGIDEIESCSIFSVKSGFRLRIEIVLLAKTKATDIKTLSTEVFEANFFNVNQLPAELLPAHKDYILSALCHSTNILEK